ncbi:MAG: 16S rRNA (cytidine(1402)-2'-O)-methyltransferase [Candidatus Melainabacteria bacterium]|nr:16S rRNA (cytidine(1402)-2'-O)-methyltransferase [Candidatus Melainabacteria bacterium]
MNVYKKGNLYVVATPIGNLEDITLRALRILKEVDYILCEDKRITVKLLNKYEVKSKLISFHKFNELKSQENILLDLKCGKNIALVSDAGSPLISDPGTELVSLAYKNRIKVIPIPGASALISALSACPIKFNNFYFVGFLPDKASKRKEMISSFSQISALAVIYIAPHDLKKYIKEIYAHYPELEIFYSRELTKIYEESWHGQIKDFVGFVEEKEFKGEMVLVLNFQGVTSDKTEISEDELIEKMKEQIAKGQSLKEVSKLFAKEYNLSSKKLYNRYIKNNEG